MLKVITDYRVKKFLDKLSKKDKAKCFEYIELFEKYGFMMGPKCLKKVRGPVWELRPGKVRLFLFVKGESQVIIHSVIKSSQQIKINDWHIIETRIKEYYL